MPSRAGGANSRRLGDIDIHHEQGSAMISSVRPIPTHLLVGSHLPCGCDFGSHSTHYRALKLELDKCPTKMMTRHRVSPCNSGPVYGVRSRQGQDRCIWWSRDNYLILAVCRRGYRSEHRDRVNATSLAHADKTCRRTCIHTCSTPVPVHPAALKYCRRLVLSVCRHTDFDGTYNRHLF